MTGMTTLNERIAERVGQELVDLIPQEEWQTLIAAQVTHFTNVEAPKIVQKMLEEKFKESVSKHLDVYCSGGEWDNLTKQTTNAALIELMKSNAADLLAGILSPTMQNIVHEFRNSVQYNY